MLILYLSLGWLAGIWLGSLAGAPPGGALAAGGLLTLLAWALRRSPARLRAAASLAALCLGAGRYQLQQAGAVNDLARFNDQGRAVVVGMIVDEPQREDRGQRVRVAAGSVSVEGAAAVATAGLVELRAPLYPPLAYGMIIRAEGDLETPAASPTFDYRAYLARQGVYSLLRWPRVAVLAERQGTPLRHALLDLKGKAQAVIDGAVAEPAGALLSGILLGNDSGLPPDLADDFRRTGMTHIIAISGFNIAILVGLLVRIGDPLLGRRGAVVVGLLGISAYTLLVGADAAVVRAAVMGGLYLFTARFLGRRTVPLATLLVAAVAMTVVNPLTLWDVGFQLSFGATLSLMIYAQPLTDRVRAWLAARLRRALVERLMGLLSDAVLVTVAAQVLTLPLMVAYFGQLSLISLLANALILPAQPAVMLWGGAATLLGLAAPALATVPGWAAWLFLSYTISMVRLLARVPLAVVDVSLSPAGLLAIYAAIAAATWLGRLPAAQRAALVPRLRAALGARVGVPAGLLLAALTLLWVVQQPDGRLHVVFFDVGQGDATWIQTPGGRQILVDGGLYPSRLLDQVGRALPFNDRSIDLVVATHADADHITGLPPLLARYQVGRLLVSSDARGDGALSDALLDAAAAAGTPLHLATAGETIDLGDGVRLELVHPQPGAPAEDRNDRSVSLRLVYGEFTLLLTGDAEAPAERAMVARGLPLRALVFKAGHHGSRTSSNDFFLAAVQPQIVVISAGVDNDFGHPHPEVLARLAAAGAQVVRTDQLGAIEVVVEGERMWWVARR